MKKVILITGGSQGIGHCIAEKLAIEGHKVIITYNTSKKEAESLREKYNIDIFKVDLEKYEDIMELVKYVIEKYNKIDVLINNAGIDYVGLFTEMTNRDWNKIINVNLNAVFYLTREISKNMIKNKEGKIINISSIWGMVGASCEVAYSVSKAGIDAMTKSLAKELGPSNIKVNSIAPGIIDTNMNNDLSNEEKRKIIEDIPLERIGKPIDVYRVVKWLIEDEYTTGQVISTNGGWIII